jgi:hypothetical protein
MNQHPNNAMQTSKLILSGFGLLALGLSGCATTSTDTGYDSGYRSGAASHSPGSYSSSTSSMTGATHAGIPLLNVSCTDKYEVHADQGGPVFINGKETKLKKVNDNYYEATGSGITVSIAINPDGSPTVSYTGQHGINGICQASQSGASGKESSSSGGSSASSAPMAPGNMVDYCRGEAAGQFATKPAYINTGKLTRVQGGGYAVTGTADLGNQGKKPFQCDFDQSGRFLHFKSLVDEGRL